jgi:hypothetical protein
MLRGTMGTLSLVASPFGALKKIYPHRHFLVDPVVQKGDVDNVAFNQLVQRNKLVVLTV